MIAMYHTFRKQDYVLLLYAVLIEFKKKYQPQPRSTARKEREVKTNPSAGGSYDRPSKKRNANENKQL